MRINVLAAKIEMPNIKPTRIVYIGCLITL